LFDRVVVGPNCVIDRSIIGAGVDIKEDSQVQKGCLVGDGVVVGPEAHLAPFARLSKTRTKETENDEEDDGNDSELEQAESSKPTT